MLFRMILSAFLMVVGLMGTAGSPVCRPGCNKTKHAISCVRHVSDLGTSSVAPWKLELRAESDNQLHPVQEAKCGTCSVENMVAKPIFIEIWVFERVRNGSHHDWCRCPYQLPVACTCVQQQ